MPSASISALEVPTALTQEDILTIDGVEIGFHGRSEHDFSVHLVSSGEELGQLHRSATRTCHFEAMTPDGRILQTPSRWMGTINAVFGTRELAVRALLHARISSQK